MAAALFCRLVPVDAEDAGEKVSVASAGLLQGGYASPPEVVTVMAEMGIDLSEHRSTQLSSDVVAGADLVLCMARRHAREVVILDPAAWGRTFTLKAFVRRGDHFGHRTPGEPLGSWLGRLHAGRERTDLVGRSSEDDVADPLGGPLDAFRMTAREIGTLVEHVAALLWAPRGIRTRPG